MNTGNKKSNLAKNLISEKYTPTSNLQSPKVKRGINCMIYRRMTITKINEDLTEIML